MDKQVCEKGLLDRLVSRKETDWRLFRWCRMLEKTSARQVGWSIHDILIDQSKMK